MPKTKGRGNLVKIIWRDIAGLSCEDGEAAWVSEEGLLKQAKKKWDQECITVGYLIEKNKKYVVIAATADFEENSYADASMIPNSVIIKITPITKKK